MAILEPGVEDELKRRSCVPRVGCGAAMTPGLIERYRDRLPVDRGHARRDARRGLHAAPAGAAVSEPAGLSSCT